MVVDLGQYICDLSQCLPDQLPKIHHLAPLTNYSTFPKRVTQANDQVDEVGKARPEITKATETMIKKGKWTVPGYRVRPILITSVWVIADDFRRNSENSRSSRYAACISMQCVVWFVYDTHILMAFDGVEIGGSTKHRLGRA